MEGMRFTQDRQNTRSFGKFLAGNTRRSPEPVAAGFRLKKLEWKNRDPDLKHVGVFFSKLKFCVFCYSLTGIRIARIAPKECTLSPLCAWLHIRPLPDIHGVSF